MALRTRPSSWPSVGLIESISGPDVSFDQPPSPPVRPRLSAALPVAGAAGASAAELLTIDPAALRLAVLP